jgi:hypothetical protein
MKRKKLDYEKLRRKFPSMNKISSRLASFLEYGEYLTYTNEEIRNMFLSLLKTFNKDCIDLKLRYDLLKLENDKFEDTLIQYENINELDDEEVSSFVRTKDFVDYIGYSQKQKQLIFNLLKKSEQNLNELISEILLSSEVREALKNDIQCFNEKYNFEDDYEKIAEFVTNKFLEKTISNPSVLPIGDETTQVLNECIKKYFETNKKENANE